MKISFLCCTSSFLLSKDRISVPRSGTAPTYGSHVWLILNSQFACLLTHNSPTFKRIFYSLVGFWASHVVCWANFTLSANETANLRFLLFLLINVKILNLWCFTPFSLVSLLVSFKMIPLEIPSLCLRTENYLFVGMSSSLQPTRLQQLPDGFNRFFN